MYDPSNIWLWLNKDGLHLTEEFSNVIKKILFIKIIFFIGSASTLDI
jgi:hypothetical protein